jgi:hypothetical protein
MGSIFFIATTDTVGAGIVLVLGIIMGGTLAIVFVKFIIWAIKKLFFDKNKA